MSRVGRPRIFTAEQIAERKRANSRRAAAEHKDVFGVGRPGVGVRAIFDAEEDPAPMVQSGDVRLTTTNLGNGGRWRRPRRYG